MNVAISHSANACVALIEHGGIDFMKANVKVVQSYLQENGSALINYYITSQDSREERVNQVMLREIDDCKAAFKEQFKKQNRHADKSPAERQRLYKSEKLRTVMQKETALHCADTKERLGHGSPVSFPLKSTRKTFTFRRWLESFFETEGTPESEKKELRDKLLKKSADFTLIDEHIGIGQAGNRSVLGRFSEKVVLFLSTYVENLGLKTELANGTLRQETLKFLPKDTLELLIISILLDLYANFQAMVAGSPLCLLAKTLKLDSSLSKTSSSSVAEVQQIFAKSKGLLQYVLVARKSAKISSSLANLDEQTIQDINGYADQTFRILATIAAQVRNVCTLFELLKSRFPQPGTSPQRVPAYPGAEEPPKPIAQGPISPSPMTKEVCTSLLRKTHEFLQELMSPKDTKPGLVDSFLSRFSSKS